MISEILLTAAAIYLLSGFLFSIPFVIRGVDRIDENAHGSSIGFRIIIIPGVMIFWPLLFRKWMKASKANHHD
jgi:hypothetical protein